jgi:hypothetical protein
MKIAKFTISSIIDHTAFRTIASCSVLVNVIAQRVADTARVFQVVGLTQLIPSRISIRVASEGGKPPPAGEVLHDWDGELHDFQDDS